MHGGVLILTIVLCVLWGALSAPTAAKPGRAAFFSMASSISSSNSDESKSQKYQTQTLETPYLSQYLDSRVHGGKYEVVAFLKSADGRPIFTHGAVADAIQRSPDAVIMPSIYHTKSENLQIATKTAADWIRGSKSMESPLAVSLTEFLSALSRDDSAILKNGHAEAFEISLSGHESEEQLMKDVSALLASTSSSLSSSSSSASSPTLSTSPVSSASESMKGCKAMFIAVEEPASVETLAPEQKAHYSRVLAATSATSSDVTDGIYYKPEGAEYSIYYADTYLYMTPDILTGLMTFLFAFFVLLTGYSCMNQIQSASSYVTKETQPAVGKEG